MQSDSSVANLEHAIVALCVCCKPSLPITCFISTPSRNSNGDSQGVHTVLCLWLTVCAKT